MHFCDVSRFVVGAGRDAHEFDRRMTTFGIAIGVIALLCVIVASYCMARWESRTHTCTRTVWSGEKYVYVPYTYMYVVLLGKISFALRSYVHCDTYMYMYTLETPIQIVLGLNSLHFEVKLPTPSQRIVLRAYWWRCRKKRRDFHQRRALRRKREREEEQERLTNGNYRPTSRDGQQQQPPAGGGAFMLQTAAGVHTARKLKVSRQCCRFLLPARRCCFSAQLLVHNKDEQFRYCSQTGNLHIYFVQINID